MQHRFETILVGRLAGDPKVKSYDWGVRCEVEVLITQTRRDREGNAYTAEKRIPVITYDTTTAGRIAREFVMGDLVEVRCDDIRHGRAYYDRTAYDSQSGQRGQWKASRARFTLSSITKVTRPAPNAGAAEDAESQALAGATAS